MKKPVRKLEKYITKVALEDENQQAYRHHWLFSLEEEQSPQSNPKILQFQNQTSTFHPLQEIQAYKSN